MCKETLEALRWVTERLAPAGLIFMCRTEKMRESKAQLIDPEFVRAARCRKAG